MYNLGI